MNWKEKTKTFLMENVLKIISGLLSLYFFIVFHTMVGFLPKADITSTSLTYLILFIFFLLIPVAQKLTIGQLLTFESKIKEVKSEVGEFKNETRELISLQNSLINTVTNTVNNNINISLPGLSEAKDARQELEETITRKLELDTIEEKVQDFLESEGQDFNFALARLRMEIERQLRKIMGKRLKTDDPVNMKGPYFSARSLFKQFIQKYSNYQGMYGSFDYILKVCNAAIHGQMIPQSHAYEALSMGLKMLEELNDIESED
jgi:hypothetical protein